MIDPIDVLTLAIISWCTNDISPAIYTETSIKACAAAIYDCAIDDKNKVLTNDDDLKKCSIKGKKLLLKKEPLLANKSILNG